VAATSVSQAISAETRSADGDADVSNGWRRVHAVPKGPIGAKNVYAGHDLNSNIMGVPIAGGRVSHFYFQGATGLPVTIQFHLLCYTGDNPLNDADDFAPAAPRGTTVRSRLVPPGVARRDVLLIAPRAAYPQSVLRPHSAVVLSAIPVFSCSTTSVKLFL
jgi:hypothetical protein